jgi:hypothetical protein
MNKEFDVFGKLIQVRLDSMIFEGALERLEKKMMWLYDDALEEGIDLDRGGWQECIEILNKLKKKVPSLAKAIRRFADNARMKLK